MSEAAKPKFRFLDYTLDPDARARDIVSRLTLEEKAAQMLHEAPAIERLGIPAYNWWNECLHGVARAGVATVFPQAIGLAAAWDERRLHQVAEVIAVEGRAKHHEFARQEDRGYYKGLTFWAPNINIFRDPRWGRGHETYGECPHLTARLGVAFCKGLQGTHPEYLQLVATPKHYAVHSGPEAMRHYFNAEVGQKDLWETYLPAFFACITEAKAESIMSAYNRTNGEPCSSSTTLLRDILRERWGFQGYVVSDCWAIKDLHENHKVTQTAEESAAAAVKAGCDLNCGCVYERIPAAVQQGLLDEADVDRSLVRLFRARIRLGMFDPPERVPFTSTPYELNDCAEHAALALNVTRESLVLLKNDGVLPLSKNLKNVAVIGPNAANAHTLVANYFGVPSNPVTPLAGIRAAVSSETRVWYTEGCRLKGTKRDGLGRAGLLSEAVSVAARADAVVLCLGLSAELEGEQDDISNTDIGGDKASLELPGLQLELLKAIVALGKPTVVVMIAGSALNLSWAHENVGAIVQAWYPGQAAGTAIADVLFGDFSPGGRLPITFARSTADLPEFTDYAMRGRTYRYLESEPLYPFGFGLSYTRFEYSQLVLNREHLGAGDSVEVRVTVRNVGSRAGDEVVQLYVSLRDAPCRVPHHDLRGFERLHLAPGEARELKFVLPARALSLIDERGRRVFAAGNVRIYVGGSQPDARSVALVGQAPLSADIQLRGTVELPY
jgi:beta-glucosidase